MDGLTFRLDDPAEAERVARTAAVTEARARAEVLAAAAGVEIAGVIDIVEGGGPPAPYPRGKADRMMLAADAGTPVQAGTTEIVGDRHRHLPDRLAAGLLDPQELAAAEIGHVDDAVRVLADGADAAPALEDDASARVGRRRRVDRPDVARCSCRENR